MKRLAGQWICCPGCTLDAFSEGNCHTVPLIMKFKELYPDLEAPSFVSLATTTVEGKGGLRDVLIERNAIFCGCKPPRGAPTSRELGVSLPASIFGNPEVMQKIREGKEKGAEKRAQKKREEKHGQCPAHVTHKYDLPVRTMAEAEAERKAFFEKAWAQKRAREEREKQDQDQNQERDQEPDQDQDQDQAGPLIGVSCVLYRMLLQFLDRCRGREVESLQSRLDYL